MVLSTMIERPYLALIPAIGFLLLYRSARRAIVLVAAIAWAIYCVDEYGNKLRILCSGECNIRVDLVLIYPLLVAVSIAALVIGIRSVRASK
jgi:hypothetical protein